MITIVARRIFRRLSELTDVDLTDLDDGEGLAWDEAEGKWKPGSSGGGAELPGVSVEFPIATLTIGPSSYQFPVAAALPVVVINSIAMFNFGGNAFAIPVSEGGPGAAAGTFETDGVLIYFSAFGVNYQFPATIIP